VLSVWSRLVLVRVLRLMRAEETSKKVQKTHFYHENLVRLQDVGSGKQMGESCIGKRGSELPQQLSRLAKGGDLVPRVGSLPQQNPQLPEVRQLKIGALQSWLWLGNSKRVANVSH
jgi:hypothetical protein